MSQFRNIFRPHSTTVTVESETSTEEKSVSSVAETVLKHGQGVKHKERESSGSKKSTDEFDQ